MGKRSKADVARDLGVTATSIRRALTMGAPRYEKLLIAIIERYEGVRVVPELHYKIEESPKEVIVRSRSRR